MNESEIGADFKISESKSEVRYAPNITTDIMVDSTKNRPKAISNPYYTTNIRKINIEKIIEVIAGYFGVTKREILSKGRTKKVVEARHILIYLLREIKKLSFPEIGRIVGGRDHTTSIYAHGKVKKELKTSKDIEEIIKDLTNIIRGLKQIEEKPAKVIIPDAEREIVRPPNYTYRRLTKREEEMVSNWRKNIVLEKIAQKHGVTRERVRQIVSKAIRQEAINRSLEEGFTVDLDEVLKSEKELRSQHGKKAKKEPERRKERRWSQFYTQCVKCGSTSFPHLRKGLCAMCGGNVSGKHRERILEQADGVCSRCGIDRKNARIKYRRDFYITKQKEVLCRKCFLKTTGKKLSKVAGWSRNYNRCIKCQSTQYPHFSKGYCEKCTPEFTPQKREKLINEIGAMCHKCGISRTDVQRKFKRDLFLTKNIGALCKKCFYKYRFNSKYFSSK